MITISLCMIVRNEEKVLARCLDSLKDIADEIIIADTGSTDTTKEIAARYTDKIYDFQWTGSFSDARNFVASKAKMQYIYTADADEYLDKKNHDKLRQLKKVLLPEIEIVQMLYCNVGEFNTVYNFEKEYRPKLYKRIREFVWIDPIHETLRTEPVVYDSNIEICHAPESLHAARDLQALSQISDKGSRLSKKLHHMYAMELFISGTDDDFLRGEDVFRHTLEEENRTMDEIKEAICVLCRCSRIRGNLSDMMSYALKDSATGATAEVCCELGAYYESIKNIPEALLWYQNALTETESILDVRTSTTIPQEKIDTL